MMNFWDMMPQFYSIDKLPINQSELQALTFSASLIGQFQNIDLLTNISGAVQKIVNALNIRRASNTASDLPFIDFEKVPYFKGSDNLETLIDEISKKKVLNIKYQSFYSNKEYRHIIHPYLLKEYRNRWYLLGLNHDLRKIRTYGLDRIKSIESSQKNYIDSGFDPQEYFKNTVGLIAPTTDPPMIKLAFSKHQAQYIITQPIHESQQIIEEKDEEIIFQFRLHPTYEFKALVLGFGSDVRVIEPKELKEEIIQALESCLGNYV